jgi:ubiquinone/menaquinone biosynthesis C-methylase UbiE
MERQAAPPPQSSGLHSVDQSVDAATRFQFLGAEGAKPAMQHAKQRSFDLLEVREGGHYLDIGCGTGDDVRTLAAQVGPKGLIVGIDIDPKMVEEAEKRSAGQGLPVEFRTGSVYELPFADASFDGARADRTFLHLAEPEKALSEIVRVLKPGGRLAVQDRDIGTRTIDAPDRAVTRKITDFWCDTFLGGWIGRKLPRLFEQAGLVDTTIESVTVIDRDFEAFNLQYDLRRVVQRATEAGAVGEAEGRAWLAAMEGQAKQGYFLSTVTSFIIGGRKP